MFFEQSHISSYFYQSSIVDLIHFFQTIVVHLINLLYQSPLHSDLAYLVTLTVHRQSTLWSLPLAFRQSILWNPISVHVQLKMATKADVLLCALIVFAIFCIERSCFVTADEISIALNSVDVYDVTKKTFINSTLWNYSQYRHFYRSSEPMFLNTHVGKRHKGLLKILLILCGDIELVPGPVDVSFLYEFCGERGLKIVHQNIYGLPDQFDLLEALVNKHNSKINIIFLSETHIVDGDKNDDDHYYELPGCKFKKRNRKLVIEVVLLFM